MENWVNIRNIRGKKNITLKAISKWQNLEE